MIKVTRITIPFSETKSMNNVLQEKLREVGLTMEDIKIPKSALVSPVEDNSSHFGNWCYVFAVDSETLRKANLEFDMDQYLLEMSDIEKLNVGDKVKIQHTNGLAGQSFDTGKVLEIKDGEMWDKKYKQIIILKSKSRTKGYKFYAGEFARIEKI
jgi:hypothetical protein